MAPDLFTSMKNTYKETLKSLTFPIFAEKYGIKLVLLKNVAPFVVEDEPSTLHRCPLLDEYITSGMDVCEVGCGMGAISCYTAKLGCKVTSLDVNEEAVLNTKINAWANGVKLECYVSDLFSHPKTRKQYDLIIFDIPWYDLPAGTDGYLDTAMTDENYQLFERFCEESQKFLKNENSKVLVYFAEQAGNLSGLRTAASNKGCKITKVSDYFIHGLGAESNLTVELYEVAKEK